MVGVAWNCRGLGSPRAEVALKGVINTNHPHFVFLLETNLKGREWERVKRKVNLKNFICVDCEGEGRHRSGGLAMFWSDDVRVDGFPFTWTNNRADGDNIQERLDRVLVSKEWYEQFPCS